MTVTLNQPAALAELTAACDLYEKALMENDLEVLDGLFWDNPNTLRYGVGENLYGIEEIRAFRKGRTGGSPQREVIRREITTLGPDVGICNLQFQRVGSTRVGRQSQTWVRTEDGWRVIAAHVSLMQDGS
ncbi:MULTISPECIES: oxalurate catabolism protein HpxZ [unclassified Mameliella]|uniref:oxalurate catabolism protein HpxZ n=1 Tax=unclassified Mameliella TaxID=2630630 RepID=UPI00273D3238|nr:MULTISPECIES: oxalurate catabolism protein HpxZ [unclassified Mameliella]